MKAEQLHLDTAAPISLLARGVLGFGRETYLQPYTVTCRSVVSGPKFIWLKGFAGSKLMLNNESWLKTMSTTLCAEVTAHVRNHLPGIDASLSRAGRRRNEHHGNATPFRLHI